MSQNIIGFLFNRWQDFGFLAFCIVSCSIARMMMDATDRSARTITTTVFCNLPFGLALSGYGLERKWSDWTVIMVACLFGFLGRTVLRVITAPNEDFFIVIFKRAVENIVDKVTK